MSPPKTDDGVFPTPRSVKDSLQVHDTAQRRSDDSQAANWLTHTQLVLALCVALVLLLAVAAYAYGERRRQIEAQQRVSHTTTILRQALELENAAILMESNHRAFLISGQAELLARGDASHGRAIQLAGELAKWVSDDPPQLQRIRQSQEVLQRRYAAMQETSAVAAKAGLWAAQARFKALGDDSIEPLGDALASLRLEEQRLLAERIPILDRGLAWFNTVLVYGTGLAFVILIAGGWALVRELGRAERISRALADAGEQQQSLNRELESQAEELIQSNRELDSFTYSVSHDLRAPLRHIDGYARMLSEDAAGQLPPEAQRYLQTITDSARQMGLLIDDLLAFSRLGRKPMVRQHVNMQAMVESVVAEIGTSSSAAQIDIAALPSVDGDPALLRQVWTNLLSNAFKYSAPRGEQARIVVAGERRDDRMCYWVRDNGVGFDMRYADKLFGVFQRLHPADQFEGTGVGLAIAQRIVSRHGGQVSVTAQVDRGACFTFELPISEEVS